MRIFIIFIGLFLISPTFSTCWGRESYKLIQTLFGLAPLIESIPVSARIGRMYGMSIKDLLLWDILVERSRGPGCDLLAPTSLPNTEETQLLRIKNSKALLKDSFSILI